MSDLKKIKIFVSYHMDAFKVESDVFQPIQIGRDVHPYVLDGMIGDNTGDNISYKQPLYSELTTSYWLLKNYIDTCDEDYIGVCHYRRIFSFKKPRTWHSIKENIICNLGNYLLPFLKPGGTLLNWSAQHFVYDDKIFQKYIDDFTRDIQKDIQIGKHWIYGYRPVRYSGRKFKVHYEAFVTEGLLKLFKDIIKSKYPEFSEVFEETCDSTILYYSNCHIMRKDIYKENMTILFDLLFEHEKQCIEKGFLKDPINERMFARGEGYLAEMMTSTFIRYYLKNHKKNVKLLSGVLFESQLYK